MLSFAVFDTPAGQTEGSPGQPAGDAAGWSTRHAHLFGPDDLPIPGNVRSEDGLLVCEKHGSEAAGLCIQIPILAPAAGATASGNQGAASTLGVLTVKTCLLPERAAPYLLMLELARHQIMLFLNKLEDWSLFDLPADDPIMVDFERARQAFTAALVAQRAGPGAHTSTAHHGFSSEADRLAHSALAIAIDAGERLALVNSERSMVGRISGQTYSTAVARVAAITQEPPKPLAPAIVPGSGMAVVAGTPLVGCSVSPLHFAEPLQRVVAAACDFVCMPMRWKDLEPQEGKYSFAGTDRWIEWAVRQARLPVWAGPVIDLRAGCIPEWLYIWENDYDTLRELVFEHVQAVVTRYRRTVARWTIVSGLNVNTNFKLGFDQIIDLTRLCVMLVRKLHPAGKVQVEIAQPFGEYHAINRRSVPPLLFADAIGQVGMHIDAMGLRLQFGQPVSGQSVRDLMTLSALLDRYAALEKPIAITALGAPSAPVPAAPMPPTEAPPFPNSPTLHTPDGGYWRKPWGEAAQADFLARVAQVCLSKPYVTSVCWQELVDSPGSPEMKYGGLFAANGTLKPAGQRLTQLRQVIREGRAFKTMTGIGEL
ncbi:MAG: endo-1,4-beta-xylanase [Phycisphaerales bacterium]|nr:endo-1,4-beta-xylanase [Phycisphaerales bacterium]